MEIIKTCKTKTALKLFTYANRIKGNNINVMVLDKSTNKVKNILDVDIQTCAIGQWATVERNGKLLKNVGVDKNSTSCIWIDMPKNLTVENVTQFSPSPLMKICSKI